MMHGAIKVARAVKSAHPKLPIIFGGWHPTLAPRRDSERAIYRYRGSGQGEITLLEIAAALAAARRWHDYRNLVEDRAHTHA